RVDATLVEAAEVAIDVRDDRLFRVEGQEAAILVFDALLGLGGGLRGLRLQRATEPCVQVRQLISAQLVEASRLELLRRHLFLDRRLRGLGARNGRQAGKQQCNGERTYRQHGLFLGS